MKTGGASRCGACIVSICGTFAKSVVNEGDREGHSYITLTCDDGETRLFWMVKNYEKPDVEQIELIKEILDNQT